jgi:hypothetical protein
LGSWVLSSNQKKQWLLPGRRRLLAARGGRAGLSQSETLGAGMTEQTGTKTTGKTRTRRAGGKATGSRTRKAALVKKVIEKIEGKIESNDLKPTVGDFIRLLQLEEELEQEQPREIKVSWVEPSEKEHATDE